MKGVVFPLCALIGWSAAGYRGRSLLRAWDPAVLLLSACFALCGLTFTLATPAVSAGVDRVLGVPNLAAFGIHVSAVTLSFAVLMQLETWANPPPEARVRIRRWLLVLGLVIATMAVLFALTRPPYRVQHYLLEGSEDREGRLFLIYLLFYLAATATGYAVCARLCWRYSRVADRVWLRRGLRIAAVGLALGLGYSAVRASTYVGSLAGLDAGRWEFLVPVFAGSAALLSLFGMLLPAFGPRLDSVAAWTGRYVSYWRLEPLWRAYYTAMPDIAFDPPGRGDRFAPRDLNHRLLRRMVEIWDGRLGIAADLDPVVAERARVVAEQRGLPAETIEAVVEAAQIKLALRRFSTAPDGAEPAAVTPSGMERPAPVAPVPVPAGAGQWELERDRLVRVARAFATSPVVDEVLAERIRPGG